MARASLSAAGNLIQVPFMYDYSGREAFNEPSGLQVKGTSAFYRTYRASDGWFFLAAKSQVQLAEVDGFEFLNTLDSDSIEARLEQLLAMKPKRHWVSLLLRNGIAAQPLGEMHKLRETFVKDIHADAID